MQSWIFRIITPVFSVTWSFRNHSNMLICAQQTFLIIINVENNCAASYFCGKPQSISEVLWYRSAAVGSGVGWVEAGWALMEEVRSVGSAALESYLQWLNNGDHITDHKKIDRWRATAIRQTSRQTSFFVYHVKITASYQNSEIT